jgi:hypothetical protein
MRSSKRLSEWLPQGCKTAMMTLAVTTSIVLLSSCTKALDGRSASRTSSPTANQTSTDNSVATTPPPVAASGTFFGLTVLDFQHLNPPLTYGITRTWDAYPALDWAEANPAPQQYRFRSLDNYLSLAANRGTEVIYTFGRTPRWASTKPDAPGAYGPGQCGAPDIAAWDAYVTAVVTHAAGRIRYWELWNEPDQGGFYCSDMPAMVTMAQHAYAIIKRIDSNAIVLSPAASGGAGAGWLANFLTAGGRGTFDAVAFHGYEGINAEAIVAIVNVYRHALTFFNLVGSPLFDTECSWGGNPIGDDTHRAAFLSKYYVLQWSMGVEHVLWYAYDGDPQWGRLVDSAGKMLPDGVAYDQTYQWIMGANLTKPCAQDGDGTWTCDVTRQQNYKAQIVWNSSQDRSFPVPPNMTEYRDLTGQVVQIANGFVPIGNSPVLIESQPLVAGTVGNSLRDKKKMTYLSRRNSK